MHLMEVVVTGWQHVKYTKKDGKTVDGFRVYGRTLTDVRSEDAYGGVIADGYVSAEWWSKQPVSVGDVFTIRKGKYGWYTQ